METIHSPETNEAAPKNGPDQKRLSQPRQGPTRKYAVARLSLETAPESTPNGERFRLADRGSAFAETRTMIASHCRPYRGGSIFGAGPRNSFNRDQRRTWLARANLERRRGRLTALHVVVAHALQRRLDGDSRLGLIRR